MLPGQEIMSNCDDCVSNRDKSDLVAQWWLSSVNVKNNLLIESNILYLWTKSNIVFLVC